MPFRSRPRPLLAALLLLAAVTAASPVVRRCPFRWSEIDLATYAACSAVPKAGDCRANVAACSAMATCPLRARAARSPASSTDPCADRCAGRHGDAPASHGREDGPRAYCLDEPFMATASRTHVPAAPAPLAIAAAIVAIDVPATVRPAVRAVEARPPTAPDVTRPPIRGPPALLG